MTRIVSIMAVVVALATVGCHHHHDRSGHHRPASSYHHHHDKGWHNGHVRPR